MEPKIRIKGFSGEWEETSLGKLVNVYDGIHQTPRYTDKGIMFLSVENISTLKSNKFINEVDFNQFYKIYPEKGDILMTRIGDVGTPNVIEVSDKIAYYVSLALLKPIAINPYYLSACIQSPTFQHNLKLRTLTTAIPQKINKDEIGKVECIYSPYKDEQQAIASYFQGLDALIRSTTKKIESLKQVKAASLQSMFPQEGETKPRVRFKGFEGDWDLVSLVDCLTINNEKNQNNTYGINDVLSVSDEVGVVNQIKLLGRSYAGKSVSNYRILKTNQIVYTKSPLKSKPYGIVKVNKGSVGIVSVLYAVYDAKENVYPDYIHYYFDPAYRINNYLLPLINKGAKNTMNISDDMALTGKIWIPSYDEQKQIAQYLQSLDTQISLQIQRLEKLKQIKSACLDNMFV